MDANLKPKPCALCGFEVKPGEGRIAVKRTSRKIFQDDEKETEFSSETIVHMDLGICAELKKKDAEMRQNAIRRLALRRRLVERIMTSAKP